MIVQQLQQKYVALYHNKPLLIASPGRVNIIGEHIDYNGGTVMPAAINKYIYLAIGLNNTNSINLYSQSYKEQISVLISDIKPTTNWATYILGVVAEMQKLGLNITGFNAVIDGDIPIGAGLSSSAAVECATAYALNNLFNLHLKTLQMVQVAQAAEHNYAGVKCGIMDQYASMFGKANQVINLNCDTLISNYYPLQLGDYKIVLLNTNVSHNLASSAYNERRQQCEQGLAWVNVKYTEVKTLADASLEMLQQLVANQDALVYKRCKYVIEEVARVKLAAMYLQQNNLIGIGQLMYSTHEGLSDAYEVSCPELDFLIKTVKANSSVLGARMMGGGFGGCTINLVHNSVTEQLYNTVSDAYLNYTGKQLSMYVANISDGTGIINA